MTDDPAALQGERAGLVSRCSAALIDAFAVSAVCVLALVCAGAVRYLLLGGPFTLPDPPRRLLPVIGGTLSVVYLTWGWVNGGRTAGDQVMGLRVRSQSELPLGFVRALIRAVLCTAFPIGLLWITVSRHRSSLQDLMVGSAVIYDWGRRPS
ncbi:RDD family protein [Actinomadura barringtoniae]|uniref:RDD family protein n=1 Tax=Actinomadura barringtoniae TaxID=1427535 RepID=A0A939PS33_9ACTN|nr:RDD family protein [Actinomadura barringtoniae]MBO2455204.1 RDD family protein [Actinomadura barringtoniae]